MDKIRSFDCWDGDQVGFDTADRYVDEACEFSHRAKRRLGRRLGGSGKR